MDRSLNLDLHIGGRIVDFSVSMDDFSSGFLMNRIYDAAGSAPILYGGVKDLRIGTQELSPKDIPIKTISISTGVTPDGNFLYPGMLITPEGIDNRPDIEVDLSTGNLAKKIGFLPPDPDRLTDLGRHLLDDLLQLKNHSVTYPLMGHIALSPFSSWVASGSGKQKPAMHLHGPSGGGKTFLASLAGSFFGDFAGLASWSFTANSIEVEGYYFRDTIFIIDDFKEATVNSLKMTRIIQNHADNQGRARLNSKLDIVRPYFIRGLLLSTGEDFVNVESVSGRTILIEVEPEQNSAAGQSCLTRRREYRMFLPGLIRGVISDPNWKDRFKRFVDEKTQGYLQEASGIANGFRIASNWALNALGFDLFVGHLLDLGIIDEVRANAMKIEYDEIVRSHLAKQVLKLQSQDPVEAFFCLLGQKIQTARLVIANLLGENNGQANGRVIGKFKTGSSLVCVFPDITMEHVVRHYRALGQRAPFTKERLKDALVREGLIVRSAGGRVTTQVRSSGERLQAWQFNADEFKNRCGLIEDHGTNDNQ